MGRREHSPVYKEQHELMITSRPLSGFEKVHSVFHLGEQSLKTGMKSVSRQAQRFPFQRKHADHLWVRPYHSKVNM